MNVNHARCVACITGPRWRWGILLLVTGMVSTQTAWARELTPVVQDSMLAVHPRLRAHWLKESGIDAPGYTSSFQHDSLNMKCVGWVTGVKS
jgi:hypothetical protein